jgi:hypothetical protein
MTAIPCTTRSGAKRYRCQCTAEELSDGTLGFCIACGAEADGVEPDARHYTCDTCDAKSVFGLEELLLNSAIIIEDADSRPLL